MKWTWLFQKALVTVAPAQSITVAPDGTGTDARGPTAVIMPLSMSTTPSLIVGASGVGWTRPPTSATTLDRGPARPASGVPHAAIDNPSTMKPAIPRAVARNVDIRRA